MKYLLDTHIWIWWNTNTENLTQRIVNLIKNNSTYEELLLSAISPWELFKLKEKKKIHISCDPEEWLKEALNIPKLRLIPLSPIISYKSTTLPGNFHNDPADQIIVATAREENATIITKDKLILNYKHVKSIWK